MIVLLGVIIDNAGSIVRLIVHDPYGDQSRNPGVEGYYNNPPNKADMGDHAKYDKDSSGSLGAYAPYGSDINSYHGRLYGKYWLELDRFRAPDSNELRSRLLPSEPPLQLPGK